MLTREFFEADVLGALLAGWMESVGGPIERERIGVRVTTAAGERFDAVGFQAHANWITFATAERSLRTLPYSSMLDIEFYVTPGDVRRPAGFALPEDPEDGQP